MAVHVASASGTPVSQGHPGPGTPSSGQLGTPASGGWKTPSGSQGRVNVFGRVTQVPELACGTADEHAPAVTPLKPVSGSGRTSDESVVFPDDDVSLSQAQPSSGPLPCGGTENKVTEVIPETMPGSGLASQEAFIQQEVTVKDTVTVVEAMSDDEDSGGAQVAEEAEAGNASADDSEGDGQQDTVQELAMNVPNEVVSKKGDQQVSPEQCRRRRQAFLQNTLCPSPGASPVAPTEVGLSSRVRKGAVGRGRSGQGAARGEKNVNMKPLTQIGVQEKFKPPGAVGDTGKGRGRGGKPAKRKRDMHGQ